MIVSPTPKPFVCWPVSLQVPGRPITFDRTRTALAQAAYIRRDRFELDEPEFVDVTQRAFYLFFHFIFHVAGKLLDERAPVQRPDEENAVEEWFDRHRLTRRDGLWLSDRRDPPPEDLGTGLDAKLPDGGTLSGLFERRDGTVVAFADWTAYRGSTREQVDVSGVLVSAGRSRPVAMALGSASNPNDYRLPTSDGDHDQVEKDGWTIGGWMVLDDGEVRLDRQDPFVSGLTARVPAPSGKSRDCSTSPPTRAGAAGRTRAASAYAPRHGATARTTNARAAAVTGDGSSRRARSSTG